MKAVTLTDAAHDLGALIDAVTAGETIVITEGGVPVANLVAPAAAETIDWEARLDRLERDGVVRRGTLGPPDPRILQPFPAGLRPAGVLQALLDERWESER